MRKLILAGLAVAVIACAVTLSPKAASAAQNLIENPSFEDDLGTGRPDGWRSGGWGDNKASYQYPVPGKDSDKAVKVTVSEHQSGDAKWYPEHPVTVEGGKKYRFEVDYQSTAESYTVARYKLANGKDQFEDLGKAPSSADWGKASIEFSAPEEAVEVIIVQLLAQAGELTIDNLNLSALADDPVVIQEGSNLLTNPSLENASGANPTGWSRGRWGSNTAVFEYPVAGSNSPKAAKVSLSQRTSGDAKWYTSEVPVTPGKTYKFSVDYQASVPTFITAQFKLANGSYSYIDLDQPAASTGWTQTGVSFTAPAQATHVTIFHLINRVGFLVTDNYSLTAEEDPLPQPDNLILNPSFESGSTGAPSFWSKGRWGSNTAVFEYPVTGNNSTKAAKVTLTQRSSGDAKWYFQDVKVEPGKKYIFSNDYKSTVPSFITARLLLSNGNYEYVDLLALPPSESWQSSSYAITVPTGVTALSIFHLIKDVGNLTVDNYSLKPEDTPLPSKGLVSITFDDGWKSIYENALPILDQAGYKSTQYIITSRFDFPAYMTKAQVLELEARGHEIGAHSRTHRDLTAISSEEAKSEIKGALDDLLGIGVKSVKTFAYPFGSYNETIKDTVRDAGYMAARSSDGGANQKGNTDLYALKRRPAEKKTTLDQMKAWIDEALNKEEWLVINFHQIANVDDPYSVSPEYLKAVVDYLKQKNARVVPVKDGISIVGTQALSL